jgi:hypothetical protein
MACRSISATNLLQEYEPICSNDRGLRLKISREVYFTSKKAANVDSTQQQSQVDGTSWLSRGVASPGNFVLLLASFALFPFVAKWTDAFALGSVALDSPMHTRAIVKFCLFLVVFEWAWFFIAWFGFVASANLHLRKWSAALGTAHQESSSTWGSV